MIELWVTLIGIAAGAIGYFVATFMCQPILKYRAIRGQIISDLVFYANALQPDKMMNEKMNERVLKRAEGNRRHSADLLSCVEGLPKLYAMYLKRRGEMPTEAAVELMGLSNSFEWNEAKKSISSIVKCLRIRRDITGI